MLVSVVLMGLAIFVVYKFKRYSMSEIPRFAPPAVPPCPIITPFRSDAAVSSSWAAWTSKLCLPGWDNPLFVSICRILPRMTIQSVPPPELTGWQDPVVINIHPSDNVRGWPFGNAKHSSSRWSVLGGMAAKVEEISPETTYIIQGGAHHKQPPPRRLIPRQSPRPGVVLAAVRLVFAP